MTCTHADTCPIFPKLKGSLLQWRDAYCDDEAAYPTCQRFKDAAAGKPVPINLLPNGTYVGAWKDDTRAASSPAESRPAVLASTSEETATSAPPTSLLGRILAWFRK
ncbi:MAG: hypothetical protein OEY23_07125 [Acidimicrobiia bacterium]|nr:hypothetical protein [Acidimicrobiia bacterium]